MVVFSAAGATTGLAALEMVGLPRLMAETSGIPEVAIGLIDGPVAISHPDLAVENIHEVPGKLSGACGNNSAAACAHGTSIAGILLARRGSAAPAICPGCSLLVRPIFADVEPVGVGVPSADVEELSDAIVDVVAAGARLINLSAALVMWSSKGERWLELALDHAMRRGVLFIAAAGNEGTLGSSVITRHEWVIPVAAYNLRGWPMTFSNLGNSIGRHGVGAPGEGITSLSATVEPQTLMGTSVAAPLVTGAVALIWSRFPAASAAKVRSAVTRAAGPRRSVVPPMLNALAAHQIMSRDLS